MISYMFEVVYLNEKGYRTVKEFYSYYWYEKFLDKIKKDKKLKLVRYGEK